MFLPPNVSVPEVSQDQLYFLNGIGHIWPFTIGNSDSIIWEIGGYEFTTLQKRLWTIDPRWDLSSVWNPRRFLGLSMWISEQAWELPELPFRDGSKRLQVEWRFRIRTAGPNYTPDPTLQNSIYCRPGNTNQEWREYLIVLPKAGEWFLNLENNLAYKYTVTPDYWGGTWYQLVQNYD
jgi:hypothetical protein